MKPFAPFAVVDIGTNSIRLGVVQPEPDHTYTILSQQKEVVRLGEGEFATNHLTADAIARGVLVLRKFADVARGYGVSDITVLGTSALREAENQGEFLQQAEQDAGVEVQVISGAEEARLIYLGVLSGIDLHGAQLALVMDIGGGSTELAVGDSSGPEVLESMKLGAIRVSGIFTEGETGIIEPQLFRRIQEYARGVAVHPIQRVRQSGFDVMYGSSGTILNLAEIVARSKGESTSGVRGYTVRLDELEAAAVRLCALNLEQRRKVPGINPERADIIVGGAAVLTSIMAAVGASSLTTSERALREGMIVDRLGRVVVGGPNALLSDSVRHRSVFHLARRCQFEEGHAETVARIACSMFDQFGELRLHTFGAEVRELLYYAAILHDIGGFVAYTDHQKHGYYLVRNSPLLGFDGGEIQMLAAMVLHHRKALPKRKEEALADLSKAQREVVTVASTLLRIAESLDRGHLSDVADVRCSIEDKGETLVIELISAGDCHLELWGLENQRNAVREVFGKRLEARCSPPAPLAASA
ncbi:MAG: Exopolyphosphatase [Armatimonadetes bacterium]|nr:Exopolyphosphatase [Armatimonadota bacterium]